MRLTFINGLPRGGTTAFERFVYEGLEQGFDVNVNQPGLLVRVPGGETRERQSTMWGNVLTKVLEAEEEAKAEGRNIFTFPINVVVKETSNVVMPNQTELMRWQRLAHTVLLVVRNPVLQIESRILCIGDRILSGAMKGDLGIGKDLDPRTFTVHGKPLVKPGTDFSHVDFDDTSKGTAWEQHYSWMKNTRNFSSLDQGYVNFCGLHPLFEEVAVQRNIWGTYAKQFPTAVPGGVEGAAAEIKRWEGMRLENFDRLPDWIQNAMYLWRFGWLCFTAQMEQLKGCHNVRIVDFTEAQSAPEHLKGSLEQLIFDGQDAYERPAKKAKVGEDGAAKKAFDVGDGQSAEWDAWFHGPCFTQHKKQTHALKPPTKRPAALDGFPSFLLEQMPHFMQQYLDARRDARRVTVPESKLREFRGVDPVFDQARESGSRTPVDELMAAQS